jgi:hypothetical protein
MLDTNQLITAYYYYKDPFGWQVRVSGSPGSANLHRFSSKEPHVNSGYCDYGCRFYDS